MQTDVDVLVVERPAGIRTNTSAIFRGVVSSESVRASNRATSAKRRDAGYFAAGKYAVAESAIDSEHFVVSEAGFQGQLRDDIRRRVKRIIGDVGTGAGGGGIEKSTTGAGGAQ